MYKKCKTAETKNVKTPTHKHSKGLIRKDKLVKLEKGHS